jgi:hypothetical protein
MHPNYEFRLHGYVQCDKLSHSRAATFTRGTVTRWFNRSAACKAMEDAVKVECTNDTITIALSCRDGFFLENGQCKGIWNVGGMRLLKTVSPR